MGVIVIGFFNFFFQQLINVSSNVLSIYIIIQTVGPKSGLHNALLLIALLVLVNDVFETQTLKWVPYIMADCALSSLLYYSNLHQALLLPVIAII